MHAAVMGSSYLCARELVNYDDILDVNATNKVTLKLVIVVKLKVKLHYDIFDQLNAIILYIYIPRMEEVHCTFVQMLL